MTISSEILRFAAYRFGPFTKKELMEFLRKSDEEDVPSGTVNVLLQRLIENGKLLKVGRGLYDFPKEIKPPYVYTPSAVENEISEGIKQKFPFVAYCVWKANAIIPFMQHIPSISFILVDVERIAMDAVFQYLQSQYPEKMILLNPSQTDCERYINMDNLIIVRPLVAEAPLSHHDGLCTPSIEKILVDIVAGKEFDYAGGAELYHIYDNAFESVDINQKKLLRYATRRNKKNEVEQILRCSCL